jgi:hypothetical protein
LNPRSAYYLLTTKENGELPNLQTEEYYGTKYTFEKMTEATLLDLEASMPLPD